MHEKLPRGTARVNRSRVGSGASQFARLAQQLPALGWGVVVVACFQTGCAGSLTDNNTAADLNDSQSVLPLERVRLYASGVGYFERAGQMPSGSAALPVPAGHLDDALTTLVVLSTDQGVGSVSFPSRLSPAVARARAGLPADQETPLSYDKLLGALRGEQVELTFVHVKGEPGEQVRGQVIDVVAVQPDHPSYDRGLPHQVVEKDQTPIEDKERLQVLLLSEGGQVLRLDSGQLTSVKPSDAFVARRLQAALSARLATRSNQRQVLTLSGQSNPQSELRLAYMAEAPTWRPSYRLLMNPSSAVSRTRAKLQAWALVHNDTEEAWHNVHLELVHGRPSSFLFPFTAPRYERRELQTPEIELSSVPQLSTTTADAMWGDFSDYAGEPISRLGSDGLTGVGSGEGYGAGEGRLSGSHKSRAPVVRRRGSRSESDLISVGDLAERAGVVTTAAQTEPTYRVSATISLAPQNSAMVPFMDTPVSAAPLVWFESFSADAERAVGVSNTTAHILPAGPLSVYDTDGFVGQALLSTLKPGGRQFAQIGDEPDVTIDADRPVAERLVKHVDFRAGQLRTHAIVTSTLRVRFKNQSGQPREAYVVMDVVRNAHVEGCERVDFETTTDRAFAVFQVPVGSGSERTLVMREAISEGTPSDGIDLDALRVLQTLGIPSEEREVLKDAETHLQAWEVARRGDSEIKLDIEGVEAEVARLREHLQSLGKSETTAGTPLVGRILEREDRLAVLRAKERAQTQELEESQRAFEEVLSRLDQFRERILIERLAHK